MIPHWRYRLGVLLMLCAPAVEGLASPIEAGDRAWASRAEGEREGRGRPEPILRAIAAYEEAIASQPEALEARWKLLRALHFAGDFTGLDPQQRSVFFERGRREAEAGLSRLAARLPGDLAPDAMTSDDLRAALDRSDVPRSDAGRLLFWSAIHWGAWARDAGLIGAVREGVANRLHRYTTLAIALEPGYEDGGAYRLLGRLHAELPRVPFLSGWVDRGAAIPTLEAGYALGPEHPGNRLLLAITLLDLAPERRAEADALLRDVAALEPRSAMWVEDLAMRLEARERLGGDPAS